jgi:hypothetical protein
MYYYIVKCSYNLYHSNYSNHSEFVLCLTQTQFDILKYKINNGLILYSIPIAHENDSEDVKVNILSHKEITKFAYDQIHDMLENKYITDQLDNKNKLCFLYTKIDTAGGHAIIEDFIKNKLNKLEHKDYIFEFVLSENNSYNFCISQKFGKIFLSYGSDSIIGIDLQQDEIIKFLLNNKKI